jgi:probable phosphomutase (TIGR03848 family)
VTVVLLIRHGLTDATGNRLYGTTPGIHLSEEGKVQAAQVAERLSRVKLAAVYSSPFERCLETAEAITSGRSLDIHTASDLGEVDYGTWTGRTFKSLRRAALWRRVHQVPSSVRFPGGESLEEVRDRGVRALEAIAAAHRRGVVAAVSHGDVIRLVLAHYAGIHIDMFHRLVADAASVSAVALADGPPRVLRVNDTGTFEDLLPARPQRPRARGVRG